MRHPSPREVSLRLVSIFFTSLWYSLFMKRNEVVILLHGLGLSSYTLLYIEHALATGGFKTINIDYPSRGYCIDDLYDVIDNLIVTSNDTLETYDKVHFVGHSLGGILARLLALKYDGDNLGYCVALGSPNRGSSLSQWLGSCRLIRGHFGPALLDLNPSSTFISKLTELPKQYRLIAGTRSSYTPFGWRFDSVNDGTVALKEMIPEGLAGEYVYRLDVSHSSMLFNKDVCKILVDLLNEE